MRATTLCDNASDADSYVGDDVRPVDVGLDPLSFHSQNLLEDRNYIMLEEERSIVPSLFVSSNL